jgi:N-acetylmuramoyl-L-alanine amidase
MLELKKYFLILFIPFLVFASINDNSNFNDFDAYQYVFSKSEIEHKIKTYLEKDSEIQDFYKITNDALYIGDLNSDEMDYALYFRFENSKKLEKIKSKKQTLKNRKIALDPGHFGGILAELEERYINTSLHDSKLNSIRFDEGTLTYLTMIELKKYLESEGAIVFCSRDAIGKGAHKQNFFEWLQDRPLLWRSDKSLSKIFRTHYNIEDLMERAKKINAFKPDITILIHYNASTQSESYLSESNYNMAFIPGAFCKNELKSRKSRYDFLRLLVTDQIEKSLNLSKHLVKQFVRKLKIPTIDDNHTETSYIKKACLKLSDGVYSRNLALTRLIESPLCYGETLVQNNKKEVLILARKDTEIDGILCSSRIKLVAKAYFEGIKDYFESE